MNERQVTKLRWFIAWLLVSILIWAVIAYFVITR